MFSECKLYNLTRKKELFYLLCIQNKSLYNLINNYNVFLLKGNRLVETPRANLKKVHKIIKKFLDQLNIPDWVKSQKGFSYIDNARQHVNNPYILTIDLKGFYPNSHREYIYQMFKYKFNMSSDVAKIMTDLVTIDLEKYTFSCDKSKNEVTDFIKIKKISSLKHIPTGSSVSTLLSYLAFSDMFDEIKSILQPEMKITLYVDDLTISSKSFINKLLVKEINKIIKRYGHRLSNNKIRLYNKSTTKTITGVIINKNELKAPHKLHKKIDEKYNEYLTSPFNSPLQKEKARQSLYGTILSARQIQPNSYSYIFGLVKKSLIK